jgi:hypothetical protein
MLVSNDKVTLKLEDFGYILGFLLSDWSEL